MSSTIKTNNSEGNSKNRLAVWFLVLGGILAIGILVMCLLGTRVSDVNKFETYQVSEFGTLVSSDNSMFTYLDVIMSDGEKTSVYCHELRTLYEDELILLKPSDTLYVSKSTLAGQPFDHTSRSSNTCLITERHVIKDTDVSEPKISDKNGRVVFLDPKE